jgi:hypothetical protein
MTLRYCYVVDRARTAVTAIRRLPPGGMVAASLIGFTLLLALVLFVLGGRAGRAEAVGRPTPNVVGMSLPEARRLLLAGGPVRIRVVQVPYGQAGEVQRVLGFEFDGTYNSGTALTLQVGTRHLHD